MQTPTVTRFDIEGLALIEPRSIGDARGWFSETWNQKSWLDAGLPDVDWVQENRAFSAVAGTLRGLHFQAPPHAQAKLIEVLSGKIFDAVVDLRQGSPTYGKTASVMLEASSLAAFLVPAGFAHGYQTLQPDTTVSYKVTDYYAPQTEGGLAWDDRTLQIDWPIQDGVTLSGKDETWPKLADFETPFRSLP